MTYLDIVVNLLTEHTGMARPKVEAYYAELCSDTPLAAQELLQPADANTIDLAKHHSEELFKFIMSGRLLTDLRGRSGKFVTEHGPDGIHLYLESD